MTDVVVTVPRALWLGWVQEGDAAGEPATGEEWGFYTGGARPTIGIDMGPALARVKRAVAESRTRSQDAPLFDGLGEPLASGDDVG